MLKPPENWKTDYKPTSQKKKRSDISSHAKYKAFIQVHIENKGGMNNKYIYKIKGQHEIKHHTYNRTSLLMKKIQK